MLGLDDGGSFLRDLVRLRFHGESDDSCNHCSLFFGHLTPVRDALVLNKQNFYDFLDALVSLERVLRSVSQSRFFVRYLDIKFSGVTNVTTL